MLLAVVGCCVPCQRVTRASHPCVGFAWSRDQDAGLGLGRSNYDWSSLVLNAGAFMIIKPHHHVGLNVK